MVSVWTDMQSMKAYAISGVHRTVMANANETTSEAQNHSFPHATIPKPDKAVELWKSAQK